MQKLKLYWVFSISNDRAKQAREEPMILWSALISSPLPCYQSVRLECTVVQYSGKMPVWAKVELLCINFDGLKVQFDEWPISLSKFQARLIDKAMEHFEESSCIFVRELTVWF